ncbi:MAG: T9SS type A sorting domain-containing protein [Bacteroidia bacterium]
MKQLTILLLLLFSVYRLESQTDTLLNFFNPGGETLIASPNGGFISGSNGYNDSEKLQSFFPQQNYSILGFLVWNGYVVNNSGAQNSKVIFKVRILDTTETSIFPFFRGPSATLDSVMIPISDLQAGSSFEDDLQFIPFQNPVLINQPYLAGFGLDSLARTSEGEFIDSFAIRSTALDSALLAGASWERWNGEFKRIVDTWGINTDLAIFPVIDTTLNSAINLKINKLHIYPNPANSYVNVLLDGNNKHESIQLFDLQGKCMFSVRLQNQKGEYQLQLPELSAGYYTLRLVGADSISIAPLIIR